MSTPRVKTEPGSSKPTTTPPVLTTEVSTAPSRIPPPTCFQTIVTVEVGAEKKAFLIHKELLVFYSDYFRGAFNCSFSEATEGKISLTDVHVDVFEVVNQFIYTRRLSDKLDSDLEWVILFEAWLFGNKYLMPSLQNRVMSVLIQKNEETNCVCTAYLDLIYSNTLPGSPLRSYIVDGVAYKCDLNVISATDQGGCWPSEALVDLVKTLGTKTKNQIGKWALPATHKAKCYYHIHDDGENCDIELY